MTRLTLRRTTAATLLACCFLLLASSSVQATQRLHRLRTELDASESGEPAAAEHHDAHAAAAAGGEQHHDAHAAAAAPHEAGGAAPHDAAAAGAPSKFTTEQITAKLTATVAKIGPIVLMLGPKLLFNAKHFANIADRMANVLTLSSAVLSAPKGGAPPPHPKGRAPPPKQTPAKAAHPAAAAHDAHEQQEHVDDVPPPSYGDDLMGTFDILMSFLSGLQTKSGADFAAALQVDFKTPVELARFLRPVEADREVAAQDLAIILAGVEGKLVANLQLKHAYNPNCLAGFRTSPATALVARHYVLKKTGTVRAGETSAVLSVTPLAGAAVCPRDFPTPAELAKCKAKPSALVAAMVTKLHHKLGEPALCKARKPATAPKKTAAKGPAKPRVPPPKPANHKPTTPTTKASPKKPAPRSPRAKPVKK